MERRIIMKFIRVFSLLVLTILVSLIIACAGSSPVLVTDVSAEVMCSCGDCTEVLSACDCPRAEEMTALIEKKLSQGQSAEQVVRYFVDQYGEQILVP
jgi:cytochrome c-type biogenesis protein CcmH/NrfF